MINFCESPIPRYILSIKSALKTRHDHKYDINNNKSRIQIRLWAHKRHTKHGVHLINILVNIVVLWWGLTVIPAVHQSGGSGCIPVIINLSRMILLLMGTDMPHISLGEGGVIAHMSWGHPWAREGLLHICQGVMFSDTPFYECVIHWALSLGMRTCQQQRNRRVTDPDPLEHIVHSLYRLDNHQARKECLSE